MFTGIVEAQGTIVESTERPSARRLTFATSLPVKNLPLGVSVAVDGVCLTVVERSPGRFTADVGPETLARTTLVARQVGDRVHLERPLAIGDALGGHLVAGHVDGVGTVAGLRRRVDALYLEITAPADIARYMVPKGSITVDGVSLTVNTVAGELFGVTLVPHTLSVTLLSERTVGTAVNLEADLIAKHVERLVSHYLAAAGVGSNPGARP